MANFESVKNAGDLWEPRKDANGNERQPSGDANDWLDGYYIGSEHNKGKQGNSSIHKFLVKEVPPQGGAEAYVKKSVWGSHVLDEQVAQLQPGIFCRVQWLGKTKPKSPSANEYHNWEVFKATDVQPLTAQQIAKFIGSVAPQPAPAVAPQPQQQAAQPQNQPKQVQLEQNPAAQQQAQPAAQPRQPANMEPVKGSQQPNLDADEDDLPF